MELADAIIKAYETKWSYINTFSVQLEFAPLVAGFISWSTADQNNIDLNVISVDTPQFSNQSIEVFQGDRWRIHSGRDELYRFSITFRDQDQMKYYRKFVMAYFFQQKSYFDDCKMTVTLFKDADHWNEKQDAMFKFQNVMIDSVSQLQFNTSTEAQIAEFSVQFKCALPELTIPVPSEFGY